MWRLQRSTWLLCSTVRWYWYSIKVPTMWQTDKHAEKVQINATVRDIFDDLNSQLTVFLTHYYVTQIQASHMENLISIWWWNCFTVSGFFKICQFTDAHWNYSQATLFTAHAWINQVCKLKESIAIISGDLNHTKNIVNTFMSFWYNLPSFQSLKPLTRAALQFKQW